LKLASSAAGTLRVVALQECRLERADTFRVSLQAFAVLLMAGAVVRRVVQAFVGVEQCLFFGEQGKPLSFQLHRRHGALSLRPCGPLYVPNSRSYPGLGTLHIAKQRSQRIYNT
jgi:hypothetical protein